MELALYQVDSFTDELFSGNPACVVILEEWLPDEILFKITQENAVAETAFFLPQDDGFHLRWFTPETEMDLCGHATLAAAFVLKRCKNYRADKIIFYTQSGTLMVTVEEDMFWLDFPSRLPLPASLPWQIEEALNIKPIEVLKSRDYVLVYENEETIRNIRVDRQLFDRLNLDPGGVIVTAKGEEHDFVSRFFTPQASILEDPVTGSAHCSLIPYWAGQLNKQEMIARQLSERKGTLLCKNSAERVLIGGQARLYSKGVLVLPARF